MSLSETAWRRIFLLKGAYNIIVSLVLLIWSAQLLPLLGTPPGNPAYPQMFFLLCIAFGVGYCAGDRDKATFTGIIDNTYDKNIFAWFQHACRYLVPALRILVGCITDHFSIYVHVICIDNSSEEQFCRFICH